MGILGAESDVLQVEVHRHGWVGSLRVHDLRYLSLRFSHRALRGERKTGVVSEGWAPAAVSIPKELRRSQVYTTVDAATEPFAEPESIARGVSTGVLNSDVNYGLHVQQSQWSFR